MGDSCLNMEGLLEDDRTARLGEEGRSLESVLEGDVGTLSPFSLFLLLNAGSWETSATSEDHDVLCCQRPKAIESSDHGLLWNMEYSFTLCEAMSLWLV